MLSNAPVERNGKNIGKVERVMVNPATGRIDHVDIVMTEGANRTISVPWTGVSVYQNNSGTVTLSLTSRAAAEASPSATPSASSSATSNRSSDRLDDRGLQQTLADRGFYRGPIDGVIGPRTRAALRAYQARHGLVVTGALDPATVRSLNETEAAAAASYPSAFPKMISVRRNANSSTRGTTQGPSMG